MGRKNTAEPKDRRRLLCLQQNRMNFRLFISGVPGNYKLSRWEGILDFAVYP